MALKHTVQEEFRMIECEIIKRAAMGIEVWINDDATLHQEKLIALKLAAKFDKLIDKYGFDHPFLLVEKVKEKYAKV